MKKSLNRNIVGALIVSVLFNAFLYWLDDDPAYSDVWHTLSEVLIINTMLFSFFLLLFLSTSALKARLNRGK